MGPYIALLLAAGSGLGGGLLFTCLALVQAPSSWWESATARLLLVLTGLTAVVLPVSLLLRVRFTRRQYRTQWIVAAVAWVVVVSLSIAIVAVFRN